MNSIKIELPTTLDEARIHTFADLHIGDKLCDKDYISERIERVRSDERAFCILNGDIMNNATKTSVSDSYAEEIPPMQQLEQFCELFEPIKDKILAITQGNHENRTYLTQGIDLTAVASKQLGLIDRYMKVGGVMFLKLGERTLSNNKRVPVVYTIYATHGSGGGRKEGTKAIRLADMASIVDVDIYVHSHTHMPMIMKQSFYRADMSNCVIHKCDKLFVNTGASLDYGGYGQQYEFKPSAIKDPVIILNGRAKIFDAIL